MSVMHATDQPSARAVESGTLHPFRKRLVYTALVILPLVVYGRTVGYEFVNYDDWDYVLKNSHVANGLTIENVQWAFTNFEMVNWHPLTWLSYLVDAQFFGLNPGAFHAVNLFLHVVNTVLLCAVLRSLTGSGWKSALVAALFAIHPLHVESVAWISERKDMLSIFFGLLSIACYVRYARLLDWRWYLAVLACFFLSLASKPTLVTLPCLLLLLDWWPLGRMSRPPGTKMKLQNEAQRRGAEGVSVPDHRQRNRDCPARSWKQLVIEKIPFLLLTLLLSVVVVLAQGEAVKSTEEHALWPRLANALVVYVLYVRNLFWPAWLAVMYPYPVQGVANSEVAGALMFLGGVTATVVMLRRRFPFLLVGWFWYLGTMVPMIGIVQVGAQRMADRYAYFPLIGLYFALSWLAGEIAGRSPRFSKLLSGLSVVVVLALSVAAWIQVGHWRNSETLFRRSLSVTKDNPTAHINLGQTLHVQGDLLREQGQTEEGARKIEEAMRHYQEALAIDDRYAQAHFNLAGALWGLKRHDRAIHHFREAIRHEPKNDMAHYNLGNVLAESKRLAEAAYCYQQALKLDPEFAMAYLHLGRVLAEQNRFGESIQQLERAVELVPGWREADKQLSRVHKQLGARLAPQGELARAIFHFRRSLELEPSSADGHFLLARALVLNNQDGEAEAHFEKAIGQRSSFAQAHHELGLLKLKQGDRAAAVRHFQAAVQIKPDFSAAAESLRRAQSN